MIRTGMYFLPVCLIPFLLYVFVVEENRRVLRLCEVQDGSPHVCVCGLSLAPVSLAPLLRAFKLQSSLTELRLSGNCLNDDLLPELISAATTMPLLRLLDISANQITGEGIKKAASTLEGRTQHAFPVHFTHLFLLPVLDVIRKVLYRFPKLEITGVNSLFCKAYII